MSHPWKQSSKNYNFVICPSILRNYIIIYIIHLEMSSNYALWLDSFEEKIYLDFSHKSNDQLYVT